MKAVAWMGIWCVSLSLWARTNAPAGQAAHDRAAADEKVRAAVLQTLTDEILYVCRAQYPRDHHNTATLFQCGEINAGKYKSQGALKAWDPRTRRARIVVGELPGRTIRDPEVSYDGRKIVFSMRAGAADDYHIWTVNADGTDLRQLTFARGVSDIDPEWLSDGGIVFSSTREPKYCMCNRHIMANLFRMEADGANIHQIGRSTLFEGHACMLGDGRILYDRWEYVDRNFGDAQGLWTCNPDGTQHALWWGNNTTSPGGVISARPLPGDVSRVLAVLTACHDRPWGALGIIDRTKGVDGQAPVVWTWPASFRARIHTHGEDFDSTVRAVPVKYADPYPIDARRFLCARQTQAREVLSICYLDLDGREVELFRDGPGCHSPMLLRPREKPPVRAVHRTYEAPQAMGSFYVQNVYVGTHMQGVAPGSIKALRIVESPEKRSWTGPAGWGGHGEQAACMNWHSFENKRILGTVPVEADGSAYFEVPGNTFVYFQALDAEGKMVQSMRSGAYVQPGEKYGCVGCHENRVGEVPPVSERPMALQRAPSRLTGWYGPARLFSFRKEVQPVFTKHCVSCHDYGKPAGRGLNLSGDRGAFFCASYVDLWALKFITCAGGGRAEIYPAYSWGAHASRLTKKLYGHAGTRLSDEERARVITWMDINAPYYPVYESAYPENPGGRMPLTFAEKKQLEAWTGAKIASKHQAAQREMLNFDRPARSRILAPGLAPDVRRKAEDLIAQGGARLRAKSRGDETQGFVPCEQDLKRIRRYEARAAEEARVYRALREGRKVYDRPDAAVREAGK